MIKRWREEMEEVMKELRGGEGMEGGLEKDERRGEGGNKGAREGAEKGSRGNEKGI